MFPWFRQKTKVAGITGVTFIDDGIAIAHILHTREGQSYLDVCDYVHCDDRNKQATLLYNLVKQHGLENTNCVVVLQPGTYQTFLSESPNVDATELKSAMRWRIKDLLDYPVEQANIDFFKLPEYLKKQNMVYAVAAPSSLIKYYADVISLSRLNLCAIDISEMSICNILTLLQEQPRGFSVLNIHEKRNQLIFYQQQEVYMARLVELDLHRWIGKELSIRDNDSKQLALSEKRVLDDLLLEIQRSMDYCASELGQAPASHLLMTPFISQHYDELINYFKEHLTQDIEILNINDLIESKHPIDKSIQPMSFLAIGGALRKVD